MSSYAKVKTNNAVDHVAVAAARIKKIQSQLDTTARTGKLKNKVCIVTGVGSLLGIGCALFETTKQTIHKASSVGLVHLHLRTKVCIQQRATQLTFNDDDLGAKHLYLLDYDPTNLPELKSTIEKKYPDVKVHLSNGFSFVPMKGLFHLLISRLRLFKRTQPMKRPSQVSANKLFAKKED